MEMAKVNYGQCYALKYRVADPHRSNADPDPAFLLNADLDPAPLLLPLSPSFYIHPVTLICNGGLDPRIEFFL
jgi:hypothetical protein